MMKRILFTAMVMLSGVAMVYAQPRAVGGRLGLSLDVSYEHTVGDNMVTLEVGMPYFSAFGIASTYDWLDPFKATVPWDYEGEWHWYMGVGAVYMATFNADGATYFGAAGRIGIEYDFWFPLQLSIDYRPSLGVQHNYASKSFSMGYDYIGPSLGLAVRYKF